MSEQDFIPKEEPRENDPLFNQRTVEKQHNDRLGSITWALILIWAGMVFLAAQLGWLDALRTSISLPEGIYIAEMSTWSVIFLGSGVLVFIEAMIRSFSKPIAHPPAAISSWQPSSSALAWVPSLDGMLSGHLS